MTWLAPTHRLGEFLWPTSKKCPEQGSYQVKVLTTMLSLLQQNSEL